MNFDEIFIDYHKLPQPLNIEEIYDLFVRMQNGDNSAREKIINHNIRLVLKQVYTTFKFIDIEAKKDLVSVGIIGLIKSINNFDISKKCEFSTFATYYIKGEILKYLRDVRKHNNIDSLNDIIYEGKKDDVLTREDIIIKENFEEKFFNKETCEIVKKMVNDLPYRDREIIKMYFGFYDNKLYTQQQIAERFNIAQNTVSSIIIRNLNFLKSQLERQELIEIKNKEKKEKIKNIYMCNYLSR